MFKRRRVYHLLRCHYDMCLHPVLLHSLVKLNYDFHIKTMFVTSLLQVVCRRARVLFALFVFVCVVFVVVFNTCFLCFCFVFLPLVASIYGLAMFDCPFGILSRLIN